MTHLPIPCLVVLLLAVGLEPSAAIAAASGAQAPAHKRSRATPGQPRVMAAPSHEDPGERARRLQRECRGRPNAGMCLGHAR